MGFVWTKVITEESEISDAHEEIRNNIDYINNNPGCPTNHTGHWATHDANYNGSEYSGNLSSNNTGHDSTDKGFHYISHYGTDNGTYDGYFRSGQHETYKTAMYSSDDTTDRTTHYWSKYDGYHNTNKSWVDLFDNSVYYAAQEFDCSTHYVTYLSSHDSIHNYEDIGVALNACFDHNSVHFTRYLS